MRTIRAEPLSLAAFEPYGYYGNMIEPSGPNYNGGEFIYYRDMVRLNLGTATQATFSVCHVKRRYPVVDVLECHDGTAEMQLPLDGDVLLQVGHATFDGQPPMDELKAFVVPAGTLVCLHPGVWHHAPFCQGCNQVNVLVALPERTYARDAVVVPVPESKRVIVEA